MTDKYAHRDWVVEKQGVDRDGNPKKRMYYEDCPATTNGVPTPRRRHRADKETRKYTITTGFIICWIGILIISGGHFGSSKKYSRKLRRKAPFGISIPYI